MSDVSTGISVSDDGDVQEAGQQGGVSIPMCQV